MCQSCQVGLGNHHEREERMRMRMESCAKRLLLPLQPGGGEHDPRELVKSPDMGFLTMERKT